MAGHDAAARLPRLLAALGAGLGAALLLGAVTVEVLDRAPHLELALGGAASLLLVVATAGRAPGSLRVTLLFGTVSGLVLTAAAGAKVGDGWLAVALVVPTAALSVAALLSALESARRVRAVADERRRARVEGEERERARWARDLHDDTLQELGALQVLLASAQRTTDAAQRERALQDATGLLAGQIATLRHLVAELRPLALDQLGLGPSLSTLARRTVELHRLDVDVVLDLPDAERLPAAVEVAAYRVVQESLRNVVRHAGAHHVDVAVQVRGGDLLVTVADDGRGLTAEVTAGGHFGLRGMRERVELVGGTFQIDRGPRGGARVRAVLPVGAAAPRPPGVRGRAATAVTAVTAVVAAVPPG